MCLIAFALSQHPRWPWVCVGNRDEFHQRPTAPLAWHSQGCLSGLDLEAGGTWMGVHTSGALAMLTNIRGPQYQRASPPSSRGELVLNHLQGRSQPSVEQLHNYGGFNLVAGNLKTLEFQWTSNHTAGDLEKLQPELHSRLHSPTVPLYPGVYAVSNGLLNEPWPKTKALKSNLSLFIQGLDKISLSEKEILHALLQLVANREQAADNTLPSTGVPLEWERMLSAAQIVSPAYGTRCSTAMLMNREGKVWMLERTYNPQGEPAGEVLESFLLQDV